MKSLRDRLTDILIKNKTLSQDDIDLALRVQKEEGGRLSEILIRLKLIDERNLMITLSQGLGLPTISLTHYSIDSSLIKLIPKAIAKQYLIMPVSKIGNTLTLAMADPLNIFAIDDVKTLTHFDINPIIAQQKDVLDAIDKYYEETATQVIDDIIKDLTIDKLEVIHDKGEEEVDTTELVKLTQEAPVIRLTNVLLEKAIALKASDLLIEPLSRTMRVRIRVDGMLREIESPPKQFHNSIISRIKVMADLNIAEHRLPQDGRFRIMYQGRQIDFRVSAIPASLGEKIAIRVLDKSTARLDLDVLGFSDRDLEVLHRCSRNPHGMMLVTGPTGSGKTTTLYSILKFVDTPADNIVTVEDPVEFQLEGINQVTIREEIGLTFANSLRSILRQDPDTIMIGEIRDFETVDIAIKSALTGHRVLSTLHTTTSSGSVVRLVNMGVEPFLITSSLVFVVSQRLVRKICPHCKEQFKPSDTVIAKLGLADYFDDLDKIVFYRGKGCKRCLKLGYAGRVVLAEILVMSQKISDLILSRSQEYKIKNAARSEGMHTLRQDGLEKCRAGITTLEEVLRVTAPDEPMEAGKS